MNFIVAEKMGSVSERVENMLGKREKLMLVFSILCLTLYQTAELSKLNAFGDV